MCGGGGGGGLQGKAEDGTGSWTLLVGYDEKALRLFRNKSR